MILTPSLPAGEARTGCVLAAGAALVAQSGALRLGFVVAAPAVALHAACAALVYLLFLNLGKRKLGAPLIAAVLFAAHPAVVPTLTGTNGVREAAGAALGFLSAILLARTPLAPRLLWPSLAAYALALPLAPAVAPLPFLVAAGVVAYHGLEPKRLFTKRLAPRFAVFLVPLVGWAVWCATRGPGRGWGAPAADALAMAWPPTRSADGDPIVGAALVAALAAFGLLRLRASPKAAWPCLALAAALAASALMPDAWGAAATAYVPLAFAALLAGEGLEELFYRFGAAAAAPLFLVVYAALAALSYVASAVHTTLN